MRGATVGAILAGGLARRMGGGDKPLRLLGGRPILAHVLDRLRPQVDAVILNANGDPARFAGAAPGVPVVADGVPDHAGPLAGLLAAMDFVAARDPDAGWVLTVPGDTPFLPPDLHARMREERTSSCRAIACAASGGRVHPTIALWPMALRGALREALAAGERRIGRWAASHGCAAAEWPDDPDPFLNVNTPGDLAEAEARPGRR